MKRVTVVGYDPDWPRLFEELRASVWPAVFDFALTIEHVGSTAVPGLTAKPVIDMDVVVRDQDVSLGIARLGRLGYAHRGNLGISGREAFTAPPGSPRHHLYLCPECSPALANHLAVRDHLRRNPAAAVEYGNVKRHLAREFPEDMAAYVEAKTEFLMGILRRVGLSEEALADIQKMNRSR